MLCNVDLHSKYYMYIYIHTVTNTRQGLQIKNFSRKKSESRQFYSGSSMTRIFKYREMASTNDYNLKVKDHKMRA